MRYTRRTTRCGWRSTHFHRPNVGAWQIATEGVPQVGLFSKWPNGGKSAPLTNGVSQPVSIDSGYRLDLDNLIVENRRKSLCVGRFLDNISVRHHPVALGFPSERAIPSRATLEAVQPLKID